MRALSVVPLTAGTAALTEHPDPVAGPDELLVDGLALGICGTDREIVAGDYGAPPPGEERLILGHESLGRVREAPRRSGFAPGDLVVGVVRRPDPVPCAACAVGSFDMCRNGRYTERGIKELHGYGSEAWTVEVSYAVKLDPALATVGMLMEPTTIVAKAWDRIGRIAAIMPHEPRSVLVTGAGPIGVLAALLGVQRGLDVHVLDQAVDGPKPELVEALGASYHCEGLAAFERTEGRPDVLVEATGADPVILEALSATATNGILCLTGVTAAGRTAEIDAGAVNREMVLENDVVLGSVNANLDHYRQAAEALASADRGWLERLVTRRVGLEDFADALQPREGDVKVVLELG